MCVCVFRLVLEPSGDIDSSMEAERKLREQKLKAEMEKKKKEREEIAAACLLPGSN